MDSKIDLKESCAFAELSGDFNPLHIDPVRARRLQFGSTVVHGVHALMLAIDHCLSVHAEIASITSLKASFHQPIRTGEHFSIECEGVPEQENVLKIVVQSGTVICQKITITFADVSYDLDNPVNAERFERSHPKELAFADLECASGVLDLVLNLQLAQEKFPNVYERLPAYQTAAILASTRIVGMECPGLHSVYVDLALQFHACESTAQTMAFNIIKTDERFSYMVIELSADGVSGAITALLRPAPAQQAHYDVVRKVVADTSFEGRRVLVIGGSRGLGELSAKILSAGGASVVITYYKGEDEAAAIKSEIEDGGGTCSTVMHNSLSDDEDWPTKLPVNWVPTDVLYFSTPFIQTNRGEWDDELYAKYCRYYVTGFSTCVETLESQLSVATGKRHYFYPSSVFVDEVPSDLKEYAAAKEAGQNMCLELSEKLNASTIIKFIKLPKLFTDQTAAKAPHDALDNLKEMEAALLKCL